MTTNLKIQWICDHADNQRIWNNLNCPHGLTVRLFLQGFTSIPQKSYADADLSSIPEEHLPPTRVLAAY